MSSISSTTLKTRDLKDYLIADLSGLKSALNSGLLERWEELVKCDARNTFLQGAVWTFEWYQAYRSEFDPLVIVVWSGEDLVGVVPLAVEKATRHLTFAGDGMADYRDIVAAPDCRTDVVRVLLRVYRAGKYRNMLWLGPTLPESDTADLALSAARAERVWGIRRSHFGWRWWPELATEDFLKKKSIRYPLNYYRRQGEVRAERIAAAEEWDSFKEAFYDQHSLRQLFGSRPISFDNPNKRAFYDRLFHTTTLAHVTVLRVGAKILASHFGCVWDGVLYWGAPSFAVREQAYSPGLLLLVLTMQKHSEWGLRGVDLTIGEGNLKQRFSTTQVTLPTVELYASPFAFYKQRTIDITVHALRSLLRRSGKENLWGARIRPALIAAVNVVRAAARVGGVGGLDLLYGSARDTLRSSTGTWTSVIPLPRPPMESKDGIEVRKDEIYDFLRGDLHDPSLSRLLSAGVRNLPDAAKAGRDFYSVLIDGRLAAWGFAAQPGDADPAAPGDPELHDCDILPGHERTRALEVLVNFVASQWVGKGAVRLQLHLSDPTSSCLRACRAAGFHLIETRKKL